jgi:hypothetical protein
MGSAHRLGRIGRGAMDGRQHDRHLHHGDVTFAPDRIAFANGKGLPLAPAGTVPDFEVYGKKLNATLYRVTAPDDPVLLQGTRLCGGHGPQPVTFIAVWTPAPIGSDVDPRGMAAFSGSARPTVAGGVNFCGTYHYEAGRTQSATAGPVHCPQTFQGKSFMQVTVYDGPPSRQMSMKPFQDAAASDSRATIPVAGWDRWRLMPRTDHLRYTLICHYSGVPHERWRQTPSSENAKVEIELPAGVSECFQQRRADGTSDGVTCK